MAIKKVRRGVLARPGRTDKGNHKNVVGVVYVSPSTPFVSALKRIDKKLAAAPKQRPADTQKFRVRVVGMGRAIQSVLQIAAGLLNRNAPGSERHYVVEVRTISVTALDEEVDEERGTSIMKQRLVPGAELLVALRLN